MKKVRNVKRVFSCLRFAADPAMKMVCDLEAESKPGKPEGNYFRSAGHIGHLFVSPGPNSDQICFFKAKIGAFAGRMLPPPDINSSVTK